METSDARKRHNEAVETAIARGRLREQQAEVQKRFNTREDEHPLVAEAEQSAAEEYERQRRSDEALAELRNRLEGKVQGRWREDFPEPAWRKRPVEPPQPPVPTKRLCDCDERAEHVCELRFDPVRLPAHYTHSRIEVWDAIDAWGLGYRLGNVVKYVARADRKGAALQDLMKARAYLDKEIATRQQDSRDW